MYKDLSKNYSGKNYIKFGGRVMGLPEYHYSLIVLENFWFYSDLVKSLTQIKLV